MTIESDKQAVDVAYLLQRIGQMAVEMRNDARRAQMPMLDYLIGMVELEVQNARGKLSRHPVEPGVPANPG